MTTCFSIVREVHGGLSLAEGSPDPEVRLVTPIEKVGAVQFFGPGTHRVCLGKNGQKYLVRMRDWVAKQI